MKKQNGLAYLVFIIGILSLAGCMMGPKDEREENEKIPVNSYEERMYNVLYNRYEINITSEPSGAKVEVNNDMVGITPFQYIVHGSRGKKSGDFVVTVYPISAGQYTQTKIISPRQFLPRNMYFDLRLAPVR